MQILTYLHWCLKGGGDGEKGIRGYNIGPPRWILKEMLIKCDKTQDSEPPENNFMIPPPRYLTLCTSSDLLLTHLSLFVTMNVSDNLMLISTSWKMFCWLNSFYGTQLEKKWSTLWANDDEKSRRFSFTFVPAIPGSF